MRILHVAQTLPGGVASYLLELAPAQIALLGENGVSIVVPDAQKAHLAELPARVVHGFAGAGRSPKSLIRMLVETHRLLARERPEVVHLHSTFAGAVMRAYFMLRRNRPRIVYCAHGWSFCMDVPFAKRQFYTWVERLLARAADEIITISASEQQAAIKAGLDPSKLRMVYNGIARRPGVPQRGRGRNDGGTTPPLKLLFVGRLDRQKGCDVLLDAMTALAAENVHLHIVGDGVLDRRIWPGLTNVTWHGWQTRDAVDRFIAAADAVVIPSRWEGFGLAAIEAMRVGRPVIASDAGALPEIVVDGVAGRIFPRGDAAALAALIRTLNRDQLARMGAAGRRRFLEMFTGERMTRKIMASYQSLVAAPVATRRAETTPAAIPRNAILPMGTR